MLRRFRSLPGWLVACTIVGGIGGLITITFFGYWIYGVISADNELQDSSLKAIGVGISSPPNNSVAIPAVTPSVVEPQPTATPAPTPTPTPIPPLGEQLERALSISQYSAQGDGLVSVAVQAILLGDYWTAIRAAAATPQWSRQAINLELVIKCAIEDGQFSMATEAASRATAYSSQSRLMVMALEARELAIRNHIDIDIASVENSQRGSMLCLRADGS